MAGEQPIAGAAVQLIVLTDSDIEWEGAWYGDDWGAIARPSLATRTGAGGLFVFEEVPEAPRGIVVFAMHPDHEANSVVLGGNRQDWPKDVRIVLGEARSITVAVRDEEGHAVPGATVEQFGLTPGRAKKTIGTFAADQARRLMQASQLTGQDGSTLFGPLPGEQVFVASRGNERSMPWRGAAQERVVLTLHPTFEVRGTVSMPSWEHLNYVGERRITIAAQTRNLWRPLEAIRSVENGDFGPIVLPLLAVERYRIRLEGSPIIPVEAFFEPPRAGAKLDIDLSTEIGLDVWFRVADVEDHVIPEAVVKVMWETPERPDHWNFVERRCGENGQINVWSLPSGAMKFEARAPGYVPFISEVEATSTYDKNYAPINLERAGRLRGRCTHEGQPVSDFEVLVWQPDLDIGTITASFFDRGDGRFEIDTVPVGEFWVTASSAEFVGGEPLQVQCPPGGEVEVELELGAGLLGRGQVVDARTGDPIPDARIQLFVKGGVVPVARWGLPMPVERDGTFELRGFVPGTNHLRALAPGYSRNFQQRELDPSGSIDWGTIAMERNQLLRIELVRADTSLRVDVSGEGPQVVPAQVIPESNVVTVPDICAGHYFVKTEDGSGVGTFIEADFAAGEEWVLREHIDGPNRLTVEVQPESGHALPDLSSISVSYLSSQGFRHGRSRMPVKGTAQFEGIDSERVTVRVFDDLGDLLAARGGVITGGDLHLTVPLGGEPFDLRVVDVEGKPISDVRVLVVDPASPGFALFGGTDANGECRIVGVPEHTVTVHLEHATHGSHYGIPLDGSAGAAELVLDGRGALDLQLLDGAEPLFDVLCWVVDTDGTELQAGARSDRAGRAVIRALAVAPYRVRFQRSDCWETYATLSAKNGGDPTPVQVRRLADLEMQVIAPSGLPVSKLPVELTALEFDTDVARWLEEGRIRSEGLSTDLRGTIRVERLPRGPYRWRIALAGGEPLEGQLELQPGANPPARIQLPE